MPTCAQTLIPGFCFPAGTPAAPTVPFLRFPTRALKAAILALCLVIQAGCASAPGRAEPVQRIVFENTSVDVIRVYVQLDDREVLLGRVDPLGRAELRLRQGMVPAGKASVRLIVIPLAAPSATYVSDPYIAGDFARFAWRFSGSQVLPLSVLR